MPTATTQKKKNKALPILLGTLGAALTLYAGFAAWLHIDGRFPFRTTLNGQDVSLRRAIDVQRTYMEDYYPNMRFTIEDSGAPVYAVTPESFDFSDAERAVDFLPDSALAWPASLFSATAHTSSDGAALAKLARQIEETSPAFRSETRHQPEDARLRWDESSGSYALVPERDGTVVDAAAFEQALAEHIRSGSGGLDLADFYLTAGVTIHSPGLAEAREHLNRFLDAAVVYTAGGVTKVFEARTLAPYLSVDSDTLNVVYDAGAAAAGGVFAAFAAELAEEIDALAPSRPFVTHDGETVTVTEKTWKAKLDQTATAAALAALTFDDLADADGPLDGAFVWEKAPLDALENYVEVDLTGQMLYLYTNGELVLESPIVSGNTAQRHTTPGGAFTLIGKYRNVTLTGPDYASFVRYWMPFNNKIGLHDASWRSRFGGTIYRANGSHGCINMPRAAAETLFEAIDESYAIVCYWRPPAA